MLRDKPLKAGIQSTMSWPFLLDALEPNGVSQSRGKTKKEKNMVYLYVHNPSTG